MDQPTYRVDVGQEREIRNVALLDLTGADAEQALSRVTRIADVATILVPERLLARLTAIPMEHVAATVPIPDGSRTRIMTGQTLLSGEALASDNEASEDVLVVVGQLVITTPVHRVGFKQLIVIGQVLAPTGSETGLGAGLTRLTGQSVYYPYSEGARLRVLTGTVRLSSAELANPGGQPTDTLLCVGQLVITGDVQTVGYEHVIVAGQVIAPRGSEDAIAARLVSLSGETVFYTAPPRMFVHKDTFFGAFFELLDEPITMVLNGKFDFDEDVSPEALRQKVAAIVLDGKITAPRRLVPVLQILTTLRDGVISIADAAD